MAKEKEVSITVNAPASGYRHHIYANRFFIQKVDAYLLVHFGLIHNRLSLAEVAVTIAIEELARNRELNLKYVDQLKEQGENADEYESWSPSQNRTDVSVINVLSMTRTGNIAETLLLNVSNRHIWEQVQTSGSHRMTVDPDPIAMIRSTTSFQMCLTLEMYKDVPRG